MISCYREHYERPICSSGRLSDEIAMARRSADPPRFKIKTINNIEFSQYKYNSSNNMYFTYLYNIKITNKYSK